MKKNYIFQNKQTKLARGVALFYMFANLSAIA